ncbi:MAG: S9 family peptidase [Acidobacteria bacterium]|nr:MAG: S9 family peptidase [Acidobacteriota bacterium]
MKTLIPVIFAVLVLIGTSVIAFGQLPPIIDREVFFGNPEYAGAQISPDGRYISFIKPLKGTMNVWVKGVDEPFSAARPMTSDQARPVRSYFWSRDGKYILFVQDKGGDENFNVYAVNPADKPVAGSEVPTARNITDAKGIRAMIQLVPKSDPDAIYVGINDRDKAWHDLYKVKISTGERTLISENRDRYQGMIFDTNDKLRLAVRSPQNGDTEILRIGDDGKATKIYDCNAFESCEPVAFNKDNKRVYITTNKGGLDLIELQLLDVDTGNSEKIEGDPLGKVDFGGVNISDVTKEIIATTYTDEKNRIYFKDKAFEKDYEYIKKKLGDREISFNSNTADESKFVIATFSDVDPGTVWLFDRKTKNLSTLYQVREKLDRSALSPMKAITYKSSDGLTIPAYLTLPKGVEPKNLPVVVFPHGGPWGRDTWGYNTFAQFLSNRGYAVLMPNFRASTGYGKKFLNAGNNEWGQKMQDDITWGVKYLIQQGIADPKRVGIMGGSYGGYATLAGVTYTPDVYAAAVAIVAPSNLKTLLESIPPYWEAVRAVFYKRMGDPTTPAGLEQMKRQSPLYSADKIKTPLMVVQGANDPRVNKREADQIVIALRDRNYPVEYLVAPDEGHGFARPVNNSAMIAASEKFLAKHLGGRYQESATPEVAKRLAEITVDPATVKLATTTATTTTTAGPAANVAGVWNMSVDAGGQTISLAVTLTQTGADFNGTMSSSVSNGKFENGKVNGNTLTAIINADVQGQPTTIQFEGKVEGEKMSGSLNVPGFGTLPFSAVRGN